MLSSYLVAKIVDKVFKNTNFTVTVPYISLHTASPGNNGANELTAGSEGGSYSRQACASWDSATPRANAATVTWTNTPVSYTHLRAHETPEHLVCRLLLEKKKNKTRH